MVSFDFLRMDLSHSDNTDVISYKCVLLLDITLSKMYLSALLCIFCQRVHGHLFPQHMEDVWKAMRVFAKMRRKTVSH